MTNGIDPDHFENTDHIIRTRATSPTCAIHSLPTPIFFRGKADERTLEFNREGPATGKGMSLRSVRTYAMIIGAGAAHVLSELEACGARRGTAYMSQRIVFLTPSQDRRFSWTTEVGEVPSGSIGGDTAYRFSYFRLV